MTGDWPRSSVPESTFRVVTMIGAYSGMRLGEIYHLRTEDLQTIDGIPCFIIQPHTENGWSPKTDAGTRIVPVYSKLIEAVLLTLKDTTDGPYLIPGLNTSKDGIREIWIDRLLGHEATYKSQGTSSYLSGITTANLRQTVEAISYPDGIFRKGWN
ncbi:integrase [Gluconobacter japonicus]|uniref:integrase n=1 Tax=Gluconobacter japonicus TaxID=376620 RepID=UPI0024AD924E|nr:integrase [Gluconobacter japonicus]MDI6653258.1 integrase [Gluconobacter japonicus]